MRTIGLSHSASENLARFLLDLTANHEGGKGRNKGHAHRRRNGLDDRDLARKSDTTVCRLQEEAVLAGKGFERTLNDRSGPETIVAA